MLATLCFAIFMIANKPMVISNKGMPQNSDLTRVDLLPGRVVGPAVVDLSPGEVALKPCQFWYPRNIAMASRVAICGKRENCPFNKRFIVDKLINTPVLDSMLSHKNCRSLCTRFSASAKPAALHSSAIQRLTNSRSVIGFACTLKGFERLLKVK